MCENGSLTEQRVAEAVPATPVASGQPPAAQTGRKAERRAEQADQHVTEADVDEKQVGRTPQLGEAGKHQEHQEVSEEAQNQDAPQNDRGRSVTRPAQSSRVRHTGTLFGAEVVAVMQEDHHGNTGVKRLKPKDFPLKKKKVLAYKILLYFSSGQKMEPEIKLAWF